MNPKKYLPVVMLLIGIACDGPSDDLNSDEDSRDRIGYRPVYGTEEAGEISWMQAQPIVDPGKIYIYGKYLLINESRQGIHVYDNSNPQFPIPLGFVQIVGNTDMAIKDNVLYADHMGNLVALTVDDFTAMHEKGRLELANWNLGVPPPAGYSFECVEPAKGIVVAWKKTKTLNLNCYAIR